MNERGKIRMDFIAEFSIPENVTHLQVVMNGGNKDEVQAMQAASALLKFDYPDSPPETLQRVALSGSTWGALINVTGCDPAYKVIWLSA